MSDNDRSNHGLLPGLAIGALTSNSATASRTEEPRATLSTLLDLVSVGLVAAAIIIIFSIASFSFLYSSEGMPKGSGIRDRGVEVKSMRSGVFPYNRPPLPAETALPGPAAEATLSTSPPGSPAAGDMRTPEVSSAQLASEPLPPSDSNGSATQDAALSGTVPTRPPEVSEAQPVSEPLPPGASEGSVTQDAARSGTVPTRPPESSGAQPVSEPLPPGASEGSVTQDAALSGTVPTRPPDVSGAQPVSEPLPPGANEGGAPQDALLSGTVVTLPIPAEKRDRVFRQFEMHQNVNLDGDNAAWHEKIPTQHMQQGQSHDHYFSTNAAFWMYRLRRECGPIKDPALHVDCVRSFRAQYPVRYASPARMHQKS